MPNIEVYMIAALVVLIVLQFLLGCRERAKLTDDARRERSELMDRIIAKDAREYALLKRASTPVDNRVVYTVEETGEDVEKKDDGLGMPIT
jgi:Mg2+/citrate symporter